MRRLLTGLGATVLLAGAGLLGAVPAAAGALPLNQCTTSSGAIVAVDLGHWGGPIVRGCGSTPTTGWQLLNQGGFQTTGTQHDGRGFICRISYNGSAYPTPAQDACVNTPPATAYWSYWHANPGDSGWSYSQDGAQSYSPHPGSVDLWTFGAGGSPGVSPDALRAHNSSPGGSSPAPAPHSSAPGGGGSSGSGSGSGGSGSGGSGSGGSGSGSSGGGTGAGGLAGATVGSLSPLRSAGGSKAVAKPSRSTATSSTAASSGTASSSPSSSNSIVNADPAARPRHHSSGSAIASLITAVLVLLLGSTAAVVGWHRRLSG